jgi:putative MATE family efflux protein
MKATEHTHTHQAGNSVPNILGYFFPELITAFVLYSALSLFDSQLIAGLKATPMYIILGVTRHLFNFLTKVAEGLSIGTVVLCGQYNGRQDYKGVGVGAISSLWAMGTLGILVSGTLYFGAPWIYRWYGIPDSMIELGTSFLRLRAVGILFMFFYFSIIGFLRGIKNTRVPMVLFVIGAIFFVFFDWVLVLGRWGFPQLALQGSAWAFLIQHVVMCLGALLYMITSKDIRAYSMNIFTSCKRSAIKNILSLSWPVTIDKASIAWTKMYLVPLLAPVGAAALASYNAISELEQLAFVPAIAFGQVITFLVSNDVGAGNWLGVKRDIKRVLIMSVLATSAILVFFSLNAHYMISFFDRTGDFTAFAARALPVISALALLDLVQLVLSASLRGAGDVKTVMLVRLFACLVFFVPAAWFISWLPIENSLIKFILIYGTFFLNTGIMNLLYVKRLSGKNWHHRITSYKQA